MLTINPRLTFAHELDIYLLSVIVEWNDSISNPQMELFHPHMWMNYDQLLYMLKCGFTHKHSIILN